MNEPGSPNRLRTKDITRKQDFALSPDAEARAALAENLGISAVRKLTFTGSVVPEGRGDLVLKGHLGATVVQPCVVTLAPVTSRLEEEVTRRFVHDMPDLPEAEEIEMPEDDTIEPLDREIDLSAIMGEALALALPAWPRADGVDPVELSVTEPGKDAMSDEDAKPFAVLKNLRGKLADDDTKGD